MAISKSVRDVFAHFQNLNLLALLLDLTDNRLARASWSTGDLLCPVAHGLASRQQVRHLKALGQIADVEKGCDYAAKELGADPTAVLRFVRSWDEQSLGAESLFWQLVELWEERLDDAEAMQEFLQETQVSEDRDWISCPAH